MKITALHIGKVIVDDIYSINGSLLLTKGTVLSQTHIEKLQQHEYYFHPSLLVAESAYIKYEQFEQVKSLYQTSVESFQSIFSSIEKDKLPPLDELYQMLNPLVDQLVEDPVFIRYIQQVRSYDNYTYTHSMNVSIYASLIAKILNYDKKDIKLLGQMGLFHDVGKLLIDKDIIQKPGQLNEREWQEIQKHTTYGYDMLKNVPYIHPLILQGTLLHHERLDGSGYPAGLKNNRIPFFVQILSVADVYDAISSNRSYRPKQNIFVTTKILMQEAKLNRLNPAIVTPFVQYMFSNHIRDEVVLNNGRFAEIIFIHSDEPHLPIIKMDDHFIDLRKHKEIEILDFAT
ncbi:MULTISPECIES: HD-GYP domain-containing protein [Bacillus]|uniref:HD-GYP domain-containing protein n=1 Tax=Bacillus TaxID=1386 RepID=UPI000BB6F362|nr:MULTISPECIES: HD-GYP domain-containing protein [Bacillus]